VPLFGKRDEGKELLKKAERYADPSKKEFELSQAIEYFKQAISLKPDNAQYHLNLAWTYLQAPELAVTHGGNIGFSLTRSAELALQECEKASSVPEFSVKGPEKNIPIAAEVYSHLCLGEDNKAKEILRSWLKKFGKEPHEQNVELTIATLQAGVTRGVEEESVLPMALVTLFVTQAFMEEWAREPRKFARLGGEVRWIELVDSMKAISPQPEKARAHVEKAISYRNEGKYGDAQKELVKARKLAPNIAWLYQIMCELGSR